jgi:hypothetical protein
MMLWMMILVPFLTIADTKGQAFIIQINDRSIHVTTPETRRPLFAVIVENRSLSDQVGKFIVEGKTLKFVTVKSGKSETVEIENRASSNPVFVPVSPAFQEVELAFGKKAYEIPPKE